MIRVKSAKSNRNKNGKSSGNGGNNDTTSSDTNKTTTANKPRNDVSNGGKKTKAKKSAKSKQEANDQTALATKPKVQIEEQPKKLERSHSFISRGLSKIYSSITNSRDNISKINEEPESKPTSPEPPVFRRSVTLGTFSFRRNPRRSIRESRLEQLCEESEIRNKEDSPSGSPLTSQMLPPNSPIQSPVILREKENESELSFSRRDSTRSSVRDSTLSKLDKTASRYGSGILSSLKRTFSITSEKRKQLNPNWSASLQNLQSIDNMVSYDDLSFINYDKFNQIDKRIDYLTASQMYLNRMDSVDGQSVTSPEVQNVQPKFAEPKPVKMRHPKMPFNADHTQNFDEGKNLYRQSLDKDKLQFLNEKNRNSFRFSSSFSPDSVDYLSLEQQQPQVQQESADQETRLSQDGNAPVSGSGRISHSEQSLHKNGLQRSASLPNFQNNCPQQVLKSRSLTHLDTLDANKQKYKASSSEYFTVCFDSDEREEILSAKRGVSLSYALNDALLKRNLSFSQITVQDSSYDLGTLSSVIDENTDVGNLIGKTLIVSEREFSTRNSKLNHYQLQKAASVGSRTKKLFSSASTEETLEASSSLLSVADSKLVTGKQQSKRWPGFLSTKNPQQNQLCDLLNQFGRNGVPQIKSSFSIGHPLYEEAMDYLENLHSSWTVFVDQTGMTEVEMKIQSAIWELVTTEVYYIHALQTVTDLFLACLKAVQAEKLLTEVDQNKLFSNIREICETNLKFWTCHLFPMVHHSITTGHPMCIDYFRPGFIVFAQLFSSYTKYCAEQSTCQYYCRELNRSNGLFTAYLAWCESHKKCNRLRLADILVRPMQRLTKYSLLLVAIRKHVQDENNAEMIDAMIHSVEGFVCSVNSHLTTRQENERLKGIMARIESYDVVDSNNETLDKMVKSYSGMFDLCAPIKGCAITSGRHLFMEGDLRFKDSQNKVDVHCFLLTDILLICKTIAKKGHGTLKVIRQPFMTDKLKIKLKENTLYCVYLNELDIVVTAFTLQCHSQSVTQSWHDGITKARHIYTRLKQGAHQDNYLPSFGGPISDTLGVKSSPRSVGSSHSGSVELNESRNISIDFEKTNSLSSDEGSSHGFGGIGSKVKYSQSTLIQSNNQSISNLNNCGATANYNVNHSNYPNNHHFVSSNSNNSSSNHQANSGANCGNGKTKAVSATTLDVKHGSVLRQSLPNLNLNSIPNSHSNTLSVPGASSNPSTHGNLLSPSHRGISYPPPSPTRATLRRGFAISTSTKNPPLVKTRNVTSQNSILWPSSTPGSFAAPPPTVHPPFPSGSPQISSPSHEPPPADSGTRPGPCESEV